MGFIDIFPLIVPIIFSYADANAKLANDKCPYILGAFCTIAFQLICRVWFIFLSEWHFVLFWAPQRLFQLSHFLFSIAYFFLEWLWVDDNYIPHAIRQLGFSTISNYRGYFWHRLHGKIQWWYT